MKNIIAILLAVTFPAVVYAEDFSTDKTVLTTGKAPSMGTSKYGPGTIRSPLDNEPAAHSGTIIDGSSGVASKALPGEGPDINAPGINDSTVLDSNSKITISDNNLTKNITQNLLSRPEFSQSMSTVTVVSINGRVMLRGTVANDNEKRRFTDQIEKMVGVDSVDNQLKIK